MVHFRASGFGIFRASGIAELHPDAGADMRFSPDTPIKMEDPPAKPAMIPQHYPIEPGILLAGEYPGDLHPATAVARIRLLVAAGVRTFIDLTRPEDGLTPYAGMLDNISAETGHSLRHLPFPIPDMGIPTPETARAAITAIRESIESAPAVYLHCWGGIGRTGTIAGCWLRESGLRPDEALRRVQHLYAHHMHKVWKHPQSPQTAEQRRFVSTWSPG